MKDKKFQKEKIINENQQSLLIKWNKNFDNKIINQNEMLTFKLHTEKNLKLEKDIMKNNILFYLKEPNNFEKIFQSAIYFENLRSILKEHQHILDANLSIENAVNDKEIRKELNVKYTFNNKDKVYDIAFPIISADKHILDKFIFFEKFLRVDIKDLKEELNSIEQGILYLNSLHFNNVVKKNKQHYWNDFKNKHSDILKQASFSYFFNYQSFSLNDYLKDNENWINKINNINKELLGIFKIYHYHKEKVGEEIFKANLKQYKNALNIVYIRIFNYLKSIYYEKKLIYLSHLKNAKYKYYSNFFSYNSLFDVIKVDDKGKIVDIYDIKINQTTNYSNNQDWIKALVLPVNLSIDTDPEELKESLNFLDKHFDKLDKYIQLNKNLIDFKGVVNNSFNDFLNDLSNEKSKKDNENNVYEDISLFDEEY